MGRRREKKKCVLCGGVIFNKQSQSIYCRECGDYVKYHYKDHYLFVYNKARKGKLYI